MIQPDFLIIPKIVHCNKKLRATDWVVYATIYWYEHMKDGRCFAGNEAIADVSQVGERAVMGALERLETEGYIRRLYNDNKSRRLEIQCLVHYAKTESTEPMQTKNKKEKKQLALVETPDGDTPGEYAQKFFQGDREIIGSIGQQLEASGIPSQMVVRELLKFKNYWTEPTKSGKKEKWQLQQTFDVKRRLGTWFRNIAERQQTGGSRRAGAGVTV